MRPASPGAPANTRQAAERAGFAERVEHLFAEVGAELDHVGVERRRDRGGEPDRALLHVAHEDAGLVVPHALDASDGAEHDLTRLVDGRAEPDGERSRDDSPRVADRAVDDRRGRELRVGDVDATRLIRDQRGVEEADLLDEAGLVRDRDAIAEPERLRERYEQARAEVRERRR